jgi:hypothetical protein
MRSVGGVLLAVGAVVLLSRKSGHHGWGAFAQLLVVLIPALILYALALADSTGRRPAEPHQTVLAVSAILLSPVVLFEFLRWIDVSTNSALSVAAVFAAAALLAAYTARRARVTYAALLAGLSALVAWLLVWSKILDHPSADTYRWLLIAGAAILFCVAAGLSLSRALGASDVATAGGLAAISAGLIGIVVSGFLGAFRTVTAGSSSSAAGEVKPSPITAPHLTGTQHLGWDVYLLVVSLALIWIGSRLRVRGLGYVGGLGVLAFLISVAAQITRLQSGHGRSTDIVGWPLALVLIGAAGVIAGSRAGAMRNRSRG